MRYLIFYSLVVFCFLCACSSDSAKTQIQEEISNIKTDLVQSNHSVDADTLMYCLTEDHVGAGGYDLVNYFTQNTAEIGLSNISSEHEGAIYHFLTRENKLSFDSNPQNYLPQFGGWCSMTLAMGNATVPKYDNFRIMNDKLYLFERTLSVNGQTLWMQDTIGNNKLARANYKKYIVFGVIE